MAQTAVMGALIIICKPMVTSICTCVTSLVERVIKLAVEKRPISSMEKESTLSNNRLRSLCAKEAAMRADKNPTSTEEAKLPSAHSIMYPPDFQMSAIGLPGVCVSPCDFGHIVRRFQIEPDLRDDRKPD